MRGWRKRPYGKDRVVGDIGKWVDKRINISECGQCWGSSLAALMSSLVSPMTLMRGLALSEEASTSGGEC